MNPTNDTPFTPIINSARIEEGVVENTEVVEDRLVIYVRCDNRKIHPPDLPMHSLTQCVPLNPFGGGVNSKFGIRPENGTKCVIMFKNPGADPKDFLFGYFLGTLETKKPTVNFQPTVGQAEGSMTYKSASGAGYSIQDKASKASIFSQKSSITIEDEKVAISNKTSVMSLGINGFQVESFDAKGFPIGLITMSDKSIFARSKGEIFLGAESGDFKVVSSGTSIKNSSIFEVSAREISIKASSKFAQTMATKVETVGGNILNPFSFDPAYQIKILSGGYSLSAAQGDVEIVALNTLFYNNLILRNGSSIGVTTSEIKMGALDIVIKNRTTALISKIVVGKGMIDIKSALTLDINSKSINIKGDVMMTIGAPLFVLNGGTVIPNSAKAFFNMLPVCAFSGMPHGGNQIVGS